MIATNSDYDCYGTAGPGDGSGFDSSDFIRVVERVMESAALEMSECEPLPGYRGPVSLEETLGAVHSWVWCKHYKRFSWSMLYWRVIEFLGEPPQVSAVRAGGIWSGFMSEARGLSWDRKSRYGKK